MSWFPEIEKLSSELSIPFDIFKVIIGFIAILLLSPIYRILQFRIARNIFSIFVGVLLLFFIIEQWATFVLFGMIFPYFLISSFSRPFLICVLWASLLLIIVHSHRFIVAYMEWKVDCSVYIMFLTTKLTYYGKWFENVKNKGEANFLNFLSYNLFFPSILAGPTFSYETFLTFINNPQKTTLNSLRGTKAIRPLAFGLFTGFVLVYFMPFFNTTWVVENQYYLESSFIVKNLILIPLGFFYRSKYYAAWYISQTAVNLSGLSQTPEGNYDRVNSVSLKFETQPNPKIKTEHWNSETQRWLKAIVYDSFSTIVNPNIALFLTFFVSACWHGFYLTYYLCFAEWAILNHISKWCYKWSLALPVKVTESSLFTIFTWLTSCITMNTIGMVGLILQWNAVLQFYKDLHYFPFIVLGIALMLSFVVKPPGRKSKSKRIKE